MQRIIPNHSQSQTSAARVLRGSTRIGLKLKAALLLAFVLCSTPAVLASVDAVVGKGVANSKAGASSQKRIDQLSESISKVNDKYKQQAKAVESLKVYNERMRRTIEAQQVAMTKLERSIEDASLIERQMVPLMLRMISSLESFIAADLPFKTDERRARIKRIRGYLTNANISAAERFRQVLEAYSIEVGYGDSIDVYTDTLKLGDGSITANILQVGRAGLYYQTLDGNRSGYWDADQRAWQTLAAEHNAGIEHAIRMTQGKESKGLMRLPIEAPETL